MVPDQLQTHDAQRQDRPRIETQIHRRKTAKAFSALESEWDQSDKVKPAHLLRMPPGRMAPTPPTKRRTPHKWVTPVGQ